MAGDRFERAILDLLEERREGASICPSEAARRVGGDDEDQWRPLMESVRAAAMRLAKSDKVRITRRGETVDPDQVAGPIRITLTCASMTPRLEWISTGWSL